MLAFPVQTIDDGGGWRLGGALGMAPLPRWVSLPVIFLLTVAVLAGLGQEVARTFARFEPLEAYRLDVLGSLTGIAVFAGLSFLRLPPLGWSLLGAAAFVVLVGRRLRAWQLAGIGLVVLLLGAQSLVGGFHWSPYYKIRAVTGDDGSLRVDVNNTPHQTAYPLERLDRDDPFYRYPYTYADRRGRRARHRRRHRQRRRGRAQRGRPAGGRGGDRPGAAAARPGARHPERPYSDPRVTAHIDDGRAFLERTDRRYDLILLALPDSATIVTGQAALRLENYLFTTQALDQARSLLKPGGTFAMYNYYEPWLVDRYANTLRAVYGTSPCVQVGRSLGPRQEVVLSLGKDGRTAGCADTWQPAVVHSGAVHRRPAVPVPGGAHDPDVLPVDARADPARLAACWSGSRPGRCGRCGRTRTSSSWAPRSCCWRRRTWCSSRCSSAPPGWSTRPSSPACCSACWPPSRWPGGSRCRGRRASTWRCWSRWSWPG